MENILKNTIDKILNEEIVGKDEMYVYHCAKYENLQSIGEVGFERFYTANGVGNAYGPGIYSTFDVQSSITNARRGEYGDVILKCKVKSFRNFLIYADDVASKIYGKNSSLDSQLKRILSPQTYNLLRNETRTPNSRWWFHGGTIYQNIINDPSLHIPYESNCCHACDWYGSKNPDFDNAVDGFIFHGPHDGFVCILRDFKIAYPVEVSFDIHNRKYVDASTITFQPFKTHENFEEFAKNDVDLIRQLKKIGMLDKFDGYRCDACGGDGKTYNGTYCAKCFGTGIRRKVPDYFTNNFARVMIDGKYNYLYRKNYTHGVISPIGFDRAPITFSENGTAPVSIGDDNFIIKLTEPPIKFSVYTPDGQYLCNLKEIEVLLDNEMETDDDFDWS